MPPLSTTPTVSSRSAPSSGSTLPRDRAAPGLPVRTLCLLTALLGCWVALGELDRLVGMVLADGYAASLTSAQSFRLPLPFPDADSRPWLTLAQVGQAANPYVWGYLAVDCVVAVLYGLLLGSWAQRVRRRGLVPDSAPLGLLTRPRVTVVVLAVVADLTENALLAVLALGQAAAGLPDGGLVVLAATATGVKWVLLVLAVTPCVYAGLATSRGRRWLRSHGQAVVAQRFSLLAFTPIAVLALVPGAGVLDQLPDVQRAWLDGAVREGSRPGWEHLAWAMVTLGALSFGLFVLGRLISDMAERRVPRTSQAIFTRAPAPLWQWLFGPVLVLGGATVLVLGAEVTRDQIRTTPLLLFCLVPLLIAALSLVLRHRGPAGLEQPQPRIFTRSSADRTQRLGDVIALAGPVVASLALVRSHVVLLALGEGTVLQRLVPVIGLGAALAIWVLSPRLLELMGRVPGLRALTSDPGRGASTVLEADQARRGGLPARGVGGVAGDHPDNRPWTVHTSLGLWLTAWAMILAATGLICWLCLRPVAWAHTLGVIGTVVLAIGAVTLLVGATVVAHFMYAPPEIFWTRSLRLREAPVATLFTIILAVALLAGSDPRVHGLRGLVADPAGAASQTAARGSAPSPAQTDPVRASVDAWAERAGTDDCTVLVDDVDAVPLVLVAAEGGGIRAAYWTAAALEAVGERMPCGLAPVAVASGVSGGAVGLAVSRFGEADQRSAVEQIWELGGPDALAQATLGMLLRDPLYTVAGLPTPAWDAAEDGWLDRAALIELEWERVVGGLAADFLAAPDRPGPVAERGLAADLILNATAVSSGCRMLLSPLTAGIGSGSSSCAEPDVSLPFSRDFTTDYGPVPDVEPGSASAGQAPTDDAEAVPQWCVPRLAASTAAMVAARFPYITPSGVVGPCRNAPEAQLIDGGYAESSGLGSLTDLMPAVLAAAAEADTGGRPVLPLVLYLDNGRGGDILPPPPTAVPEVLVPPLGYLNAGPTQKSTAAFLQRASGQPVEGDRVLPVEVFVVAQPSEPAVEAPLGWVLSQASRDDMDLSLAQARDDADSLCAGSLSLEDYQQRWRAGGQAYPQLPRLLALAQGCDLPSS